MAPPAAGTNVIAYNTGKGVVVTASTATGNNIRANSIHDNTGLGIDLNNDGVTVNTAGGPHAGPNNLQNYPVLLTASPGSSPRITGTLNSAASTTFTLDFYLDEQTLWPWPGSNLPGLDHRQHGRIGQCQLQRRLCRRGELWPVHLRDHHGSCRQCLGVLR